MPKEYPRFTVIIPQKDRAEYLIHTLRTCMIQDYPNFEIIVSDDCSEDNSVEVARELAKKDSRIKVFAHKHHLGMRDNFEFALSQVQSGYVMALGGDDGLVYGAIQRMYEIIQQTGVELLTWANAGFTYGENIGMSVRHVKCDGVHMIKSEDFLNKIAKTFHYLVMDCPMFYIKGIASVDLVNKVKARTPDHCFYHCPTPDGFSGVVLAGEVEEYAYTEEPLSINGSTVKSQGANYMRSDVKSRQESEQFFKDNIRKTMHKDLAYQPYSPLITLMTADYLLSARDLPGWPGKFKEINFSELIRACFHEMATCPFAEEVLPRELKIVQSIAEYHGLSELFDELYKQTKRLVAKRNNVNYPFITSNVIAYSGKNLGIKNIYEAALVIPFFHKKNQYLSIRYYWNYIAMTIKKILDAKKVIKVNFPQI